MDGTDALHGSLPALVTPLTADGEVHLADLEALVRRALDDGARGVLVAGSTGEGALLTPDQRVAMTRRARAATDPGGVVVAGASGTTVAELDDDVARLAEAGADLVLVLAPATYPLAPDELVDLHLGVAERAGIDTLAYHIPQFTGSSLTPEAVRQLAAHPRVVGMKDSSDDADRRAAFAAAVRDVDAFDIVTGHAPSLRAALEAGVAGSITAIANVRQRQVVALHEAVRDGDDTAATELQGLLARVTDGMAAVGRSNPAVLKAALQLEGIVAERWCVPPLGSVAPPHLDRVRTALMG